jgi:hypothetical protein
MLLVLISVLIIIVGVLPDRQICARQAARNPAQLVGLICLAAILQRLLPALNFLG